LQRSLIILNISQTELAVISMSHLSDQCKLTVSVGIGSDYDGIESTPKGLEDVSKYPNLVSTFISARKKLRAVCRVSDPGLGQ